MAVRLRGTGHASRTTDIEPVLEMPHQSISDKSIRVCLDAIVSPGSGSRSQEIASIGAHPAHSREFLGTENSLASKLATPIIGSKPSMGDESRSSSLMGRGVEGMQREGATRSNKRLQSLSPPPTDDVEPDRQRKRSRIGTGISIGMYRVDLEEMPLFDSESGTGKPSSRRRPSVRTLSPNSSESFVANTLNPMGEKLSSYNPDMQVTLQCAKKWYRIQLLTIDMYGGTEDTDEANLTAAADAANHEAITAIPPHPLIDFATYPGQRTLIRNTRYWLRGRFKTKTQNLICSAYPDVFKLYNEAEAIQQQLMKETSEIRRKHIQKQLLKKQRQCGTGITRLLQTMCYSKSPGCGDAARHPDFFDPPPRPLIAFSCAISGVFKPRNLDLNAETMYFEMLGLLDDYASSDPKAFEEGMAELSQFCFSRYNIRRSRKASTRSSTSDDTEEGDKTNKEEGGQSTKSEYFLRSPFSTSVDTEARWHQRTPTPNFKGRRLESIEKTEDSENDTDDAPVQRGVDEDGINEAELQVLLGFSPEELEQQGFRGAVIGGESSSIDVPPLSGVKKTTIAAWEKETARQLGARLAVRQAARLDTSGTTPLPVIDYRDEEQDVVWSPTPTIRQDPDAPSDDDSEFREPNRQTNPLWRGSIAEEYSRPDTLERIVRMYKQKQRRENGASSDDAEQSSDEEVEATEPIDTEPLTQALITLPPRTKLEKFYDNLDMNDAIIGPIPRRKDGNVPNPKKRKRNAQSSRATVTLSLQKCKGIVHIFIGFLHAYPHRTLLGNFVIKATVAVNGELRKQAEERNMHTKDRETPASDLPSEDGVDDDHDDDQQEPNRPEESEQPDERDEDKLGEDAQDDDDLEKAGLAENAAVEVDFKRCPHAFWVVTDSGWWLRSLMKSKARLLVQAHWAAALSGPQDLVKERVKRLLLHGNFCQEIFDPLQSASKPKNAFRNPILSWLIALVYWAPSGGSSEAYKYRRLYAKATPFLIAFAATTTALRINIRVEREHYFTYLGHLAKYEKIKPGRYEKLLADFGATCQDPKTLCDARNVCIGRHTPAQDNAKEDEMPFNSDEE
ncbi:hypothetical protein CALCODRAFT_510782 [Calocera cornea HHB12733]|uniref:DUF6532 domain-containing protein n=1 Tax=Calocera cornea HHB12733 TaxID=1353952 RepID=A0A165E9F6_9BASI|nr:hypothetical protein CALCODRAFT_510782 [Calocera cornea HHB12733]